MFGVKVLDMRTAVRDGMFKIGLGGLELTNFCVSRVGVEDNPCTMEDNPIAMPGD